MRVLPDPAQDIHPVQVRQVQVQQDQAEGVKTGADHFPCFLSRFRAEHLVLRFQIGFQDLAVDKLVLDDQDLPLSHGGQPFPVFARKTRPHSRFTHGSLLLSPCQGSSLRRRTFRSVSIIFGIS